MTNTNYNWAEHAAIDIYLYLDGKFEISQYYPKNETLNEIYTIWSNIILNNYNKQKNT